MWVDYGVGQDCIRYFAAGAIENAPLALVFLAGDKDVWARQSPEEIPGNTVEGQSAIAERMARQVRMPFILMERPGTFGSSGNHFERRQPKEFLALDAALTEIRQRYGIKQLVLLGHSGGGTAVAALLTFGRTDIACAVITSGAFALVERAKILSQQNGWKIPSGLEKLYDPLNHLNGVARDPKRQIILIGNEKDRRTPFALQKKFADALRDRGHNVRLVTSTAAPPSYHNLKDSVGFMTAMQCASDGH